METLKLLPPLIINSFSIGILLVFTIILFYIYRYSKQRIYLSILFISLFGIIFTGGELCVAVSHILDSIYMGRQFHRIQALSAVFFIFGVPFVIDALLELTPLWRRINSVLIIFGIIVSIVIIFIAFIYPDLFISQTKGIVKDIMIPWAKVRGRPGVLYIVRDILLNLTMVYLLVALFSDLWIHRRYEYILLPLIGCFVAIAITTFNFMYIYRVIDFEFLQAAFPSLTTNGIVIFSLFFMLTFMKKFIYQTREITRVRKIESLGIFAGGIAHDFNNLLTAVIGNISLAKMSCDECKDQHVGAMLDEAEMASMRAKKLTQQLLSFSRGGAPIKDIVDISEVLIETVKFVLSGSNIKYEFRIAEDLKYVNVDKGQLGQVIQNLVINAMQAMPDGGILYVFAENGRSGLGNRLPVMTDDNFIKITIQDQGTGMTRQDLDRIFEPYFTTKETGNGLGLTVSYSIIKNHKGYIFARSKKGEGTAFDIYLPSTEEVKLEINKKEKEDIDLSGNILLMDDEETVLRTGCRMLEKMGFDVTLTSDGQKAIDIYKESLKKGDDYTLVIMDLTVPGGIGGKEAAAVIKELNPDAKIIVSSGYSNDPVMSEYQKYGFCDIVLKPYNYNDLKDVITGILSKG